MLPSLTIMSLDKHALLPIKHNDLCTCRISPVHSFFFLVSLGGVWLSPLGTPATVGLLYKPRMINDDYGAVSGMRTGRWNRSTRRKSAPVPLCPPQIPHDLAWDRTRAAAVGSQRLTAWAMARPLLYIRLQCYRHINVFDNNTRSVGPLSLYALMAGFLHSGLYRYL
jgi:hypothetical protein